MFLIIFLWLLAHSLMVTQGRVQKLKRAKVWSLTIEGGHTKPNPYSDLQFLLNFLCALPFTPFVEKLYIGVFEGSISRSMTKDHTFALFTFWTLWLPKKQNNSSSIRGQVHHCFVAHLTPIVYWLLKGEILPSATPIYNFFTNWVNGSAHKKFKRNSKSE